MEITLDDVKTFIEENKDIADVQAYVAELVPETTLSKEKVVEFLGTEDGKILLQPSIDQAVTKAVKTRDKAHEQVMEAEIKKRVAAEVLKLNPAEEPWQREIRELKTANEAEKAERAKDNLKRQLVESAAKIKIEPFFIDDFVPASKEEGDLYLQKIADYTKKIKEETVNELMAKGYKPGAGEDSTEHKGKMTPQEYAKLSFNERIAMVESGEVDEVN